jgi:hypothetical protein
MDVLPSVLGAIVIALVSGIVGQCIGIRNSVKKENCNQIRGACQALLIFKIDTLSEKIDSLTVVVNNKLLGI